MKKRIFLTCLAAGVLAMTYWGCQRAPLPTLPPPATQTFTPTVTFTCSNNLVLGETVTSPGSLAPSGTWVQKYVLSQSGKVNGFQVQLASVTAGTTIHMGIYSDNVGNPANLLYVTPLQVATTGLNNFLILAGNPQLASGTYWLALNNVSGSMAVTGGNNVNSDWNTAAGQDMPNPFPPNAHIAISQSYYLSASINSCSFTTTTTPLPTSTATGGATSTSTPTNSPTNSPTNTITYTFTNTPTPSTTNTAANTSTFTATNSATNSPTDTPTNTVTNTFTPTSTPSPTSTFTFTATGTITVSCNPQTIVNFFGNLNSAQRSDQPGGITGLGGFTGGTAILPFMLSGPGLNGSKAQYVTWSGEQAIQQLSDFTQPPEGACFALPNHTQPLMVAASSLTSTRAGGVTTYAWNQGATFPPAFTATETFTDSLGATRQVKILFYQVNDLGTAVPSINAGAPITQAAWAWFAFETTGGLQPANSTLIGGTGVFEGDITLQSDRSQNRCIVNDMYWGDFIYFNSDGSVNSEGGVLVRGGCAAQMKPFLYLPLDGNYSSPDPNNPQYVVELNFGTGGIPGSGMRDGVTGDSAPSTIY